MDHLAENIADCGDIHDLQEACISKLSHENEQLQTDPHEDDMEESSLGDIVAHAEDYSTNEEALPVRATSLTEPNLDGNGDDTDSGSDEVDDRVGDSDDNPTGSHDINTTSSNNAVGEHWAESDCKPPSEENGEDPKSTTVVRESLDAEGEADDGEKEEEQEKKEEEREHAANADDHFDDGDYEIPKTILTEKEHVNGVHYEAQHEAQVNGHSLKCAQCECRLTDGTAHAFEDSVYCENHHEERLQVTRNDDVVRHTYSENLTEEEMPSPHITKNLVVKFQQGGDPEQSRRSISPNSTPSKPGKLGDWVPESQEEIPLQPRADEVLPPEGLAKRLVQQWSNINAGDSISKPLKAGTEEPQYAPNTAKTIAAKFAAGLPDSTNSQSNGSDEPDHQRPCQGQARGLIAKFSAMQS